jgi:NAD(P)-dependent dehydrogenase (short-subunit alcohol dehydrogenase family)
MYMNSNPFDPGLEGAICVVTGGARGIGSAIVRRLLDADCSVHVIDRDREPIRKWKETIGSEHEGMLHCHRADVSDASAIRQILGKMEKLDVLVNNAGTPGYQPFSKMSRNEWDRTLQNNATGAFQCSRLALNKLRKSKRAAIVNVSTIEANMPESGTAHYAAAKGALESFTCALAVELGPERIRVNTVAPGAITVAHNKELFAEAKLKKMFRNRIPLGGCPGEPRDIADAVVFLASPLAKYVTGATLVVDGGWTVKA